MRSPYAKLALLLVSFLVFGGLAETLYRSLAPSEKDLVTAYLVQPGAPYLRDTDGVELPAKAAVEKGLMRVRMDGPRPENEFVPNASFFFCYRDTVAPWLDERGCVPVAFNRYGLREREEVCGDKPAGQKRVVCVGDSFTVGWGVRAEKVWTRLVEERLRADVDDAWRTVNCGFAGTYFLDEYAHALKTRFMALEPDVAVATVCLNDLVRPNEELSHANTDAAFWDDDDRPWWHGSRIVRDLVRARALRDRRALDPDRDWVQELLDDDELTEAQRAPLWAGGGAQQALLDMRDACRAKGVRYAVVIWPLFQQLGAEQHYPFAKLHDLVTAFCAENDIACLDLLPTFRGQVTEQLWVSLTDLHGNDRAQALAAPVIAAFLAEQIAR